MRTSKRLLAGVAAGALTMALVPFVATSSAQADPGVGIAASGAGTVSPVRHLGTAGTRNITIPAAFISFPKVTYPSLSAQDNLRFYLDIAPSAAARVFIDTTAGAVDDSFVQLGSLDDTVLSLAKIGAGVAPNVSVDDSFVRIGVDTAGTYAGKIANGTDTVSFNFTTTGAPTTMELAPAASTIPVGGTQILSVTLKDADGNVTQPTLVDSVTVTPSRGTIATSPLTVTSLATSALSDGSATVTFTGANTAGTATVTAAPFGTLGATGVTAQTATVTESGVISDDTVIDIRVTAPTNAINLPLPTANTPARDAQVPAGSSTVTVQIDDTTANAAGTVLRYRAVVSAGTVNGAASTSVATATFVEATTNASKRATLTFALGGNALQANATLTVVQVNSANAALGGSQIVVTQLQPTVTAGSIEVSPDDSNVAALGTTTPVTVTVDDSFGTPQAGWTVNAYRATTVGSNTPIGSGTTNASGVATVNVTNASTAVNNTVEQYSFRATPPVGSSADVPNALQITYTTTGEITSLGVSAAPALNPAEVTNTTTTITTAPLLTVPFDGTANTTSANTFTVATGANGAAANGEVGQFRFNPIPKTAVTASVPDGAEGVFVSTTASTLWSAGQTSVTVSADDTLYVFGTKAQTTAIQFTAGGKSVTIPVKVQTAPEAAYNIAISPAEQAIATGGFATAMVAVTDVFGNPVAGTSDDTGGVTVSASGAVLLGGFNATQRVNTNASGVATVTIIGANTVGEGLLTAVPTNGTALSGALAFRPVFTPPAGAPAPVLAAVAEVGVGEAPVVPTILIDGSRDGQRIDVDGVTFSIAEGTEVYPFIKFPGQSGFTQGTAVRTVSIVDEDEQIGEFAWGRNTGKRTAVQFRDADGLRSNTIIIAAR